MRETTKHRIAFQSYVDLGPRRSLEALHQTLRNDSHGLPRPPSARSLARWSAEFHWQERIADLEREARIQQAQQQVQAIEEMNERQSREGLLLQQKAVTRLQSLLDDELKPGEAIRALAEGARLERLARGDVTERVSTRSDENDLSGFSLEQLRVLADYALARSRGVVPSQPPQLSSLDPGSLAHQGETDTPDTSLDGSIR